MTEFVVAIMTVAVDTTSLSLAKYLIIMTEQMNQHHSQNVAVVEKS